MALNFAGVVLAGGAARRLGGRDKLMLPVRGRPMLERTLRALAEADPIIVVGPRRPIATDVRWVREHPVGSGPLAGLAAGLREIPQSVDLVAVLAADHPHITESTFARLRAAAGQGSGAVLIDEEGNRQWLLGVWRAEILRRSMPREVQDRPVRALLGPLAPVSVPAAGAEASDVDTPEDLWRAERCC